MVFFPWMKAQGELRKVWQTLEPPGGLIIQVAVGGVWHWASNCLPKGVRSSTLTESCQGKGPGQRGAPAGERPLTRAQPVCRKEVAACRRR